MSSIAPTIVPHLWFDKEAVEAAEFYVSVFPDSRITNVTRLEHAPSGGVDIVGFELLGQTFEALNGGPMFTFDESLSFMVECDAQREIDRYWTASRSDGGASR